MMGSFGYSAGGNAGNGGQGTVEDGEESGGENDGDVFAQSYYGAGSKK